MRTALVLVCSLSLFGCAAVFRGSKDTVVVESDPTGADARKNDPRRGNKSLGETPLSFDAERKGMTQVILTKKGFDEHHGTIKKSMNAFWLAMDIVTCPITICIPLIVDASTGAWFDVEHKYVAQLTPSTAAASTSSPFAGPPPLVTPTSTPTAGPPPEMSESERKATARAAYLAGIALQEKGGCPGALPRFETAQRYYPAPTHLLHIGQCQAAVGKLVEAAETYETLSRSVLAADASEAFHQAQDEGRRELARVKPRIPTLRVQTTPSPSTLTGVVVKMNDTTIPSELLGLTRPVNPGTYNVTVWATGYKPASQRIDLPEGGAQQVTLTLGK